MVDIKNNNIEFYQNLGKLFYAIAAADHNVRKEELDTLQDMVNRDWLAPNSIDANFNRDIENAIVNTFKWLNDDNEYSAETCYKSFVRFKKNHETLFSDKIKTRIMTTAGKIAASFSGSNKSELMILAQLNIELKK